MSDKKLTPTQQKILDFLKERPRSYTAEVAKHLWPDSSGWNRMSGGWNGCRGKMMPAKAGALLHRMHKLGLVRLEYSSTSRAGATPLWSVHVEGGGR